MKKISKFIFKETNFILLLIFLMTTLGLIPVLYDQFKVNPPNSVYVVGHNYIPDYFQYLSWMKDGSENKLLITSRYSSEEFARKPVYLFYPALGWLSAKIGLPHYYGYNLSRLILSLAKMFAVYLLIALLFNSAKKRKIAFATALFLPSFYHFFPFEMIRKDITSMDVLQRNFFIPHDLTTTILVILGVIFFQQWLSSNTTFRISLKKIILSATMFFLASITNPAMLSFFYLFLGLASACLFLANKQIRKKLVLGSSIVFVAGLILIVYYQKLFSTTLPFSWLYYQQKVVYLGVGFKQYFACCGPTILFFLFGLPYFLKKKSLLGYFIVVWGLVPFFFLPFLGRLIPISQERLFELSHHLPLAILATAGLYQVADFLKTKIKQKEVLTFTPPLLLATTIFFTSVYFYHSLSLQIRMFDKPYFNIYVPKPVLNTYIWLDQNTPEGSVVASSFYTSSMLPAFTHNKVLLGHEFVTYKADERKIENTIIFNPNSDLLEIQNILNERKIRYLLLTPETGFSSLTNLSKLKNVKEVYNLENNIILKTGD